mmetsp:Transcript_1171/g.3461  ORF Transcript_1171/g.3461 Transcript_1171/m.3461 type:complete len:145 (-) Transcript_1171:6900-7334(-)
MLRFHDESLRFEESICQGSAHILPLPPASVGSHQVVSIMSSPACSNTKLCTSQDPVWSAAFIPPSKMTERGRVDVVLHLTAKMLTALTLSRLCFLFFRTLFACCISEIPGHPSCCRVPFYKSLSGILKMIQGATRKFLVLKQRT